jgi:hypothetical protein
MTILIFWCPNDIGEFMFGVRAKGRGEKDITAKTKRDIIIYL